MSWHQFDATIETQLKPHPPLDYLLIQLGGNDLVQVKSIDLINDITCSLLRLRLLCPNLVIIWSDILPRLFWYGANKPIKINEARKRVNSAVRSFVLQHLQGGRVIKHPNIKVCEINLYRHDGVHLSNHGNAVYLNSIQAAIECFTSNSKNNTFPMI